MKTGGGRDERPYPGGDAYGHHQNVVDHEGGASDQPGITAKIFRCDGIGASAAGISSNRLDVGEVDDRQKHDNTRAHRHNIRNPGSAKRNQQRQSGFRSVSR